MYPSDAQAPTLPGLMRSTSSYSLKTMPAELDSSVSRVRHIRSASSAMANCATSKRWSSSVALRSSGIEERGRGSSAPAA